MNRSPGRPVPSTKTSLSGSSKAAANGTAPPPPPNAGEPNLLPGDIDYLESVLSIFADHILTEDYENCVVYDGAGGKTPFPDGADRTQQRDHLRRYVDGRLRRIAMFEYSQWINGRMPFVTVRDLQLWRLHQFCQYIWKWNLPEEEHIATIFNLTRRRANSLVSDFVARFRKLYLYPLIIRSLFRFLRKNYNPDVKPEESFNHKGRRFRVTEGRHIEEMDAILKDPTVREKIGGDHIVFTFPEDDRMFFLREETIKALLDDKIGVEAELSKLYKLPSEQNQ
ncbi:hypothetical protein NLM16_16655 [Bradyrhizobium brasilense]|uniref:hypothetical protein n=1 Tax=Bradyrhizobium brasilense TaxID=1419277 RepID=UPI0028775DFF|nr:hypothetical protein [Bradyrhizobium brasilense]MCP3415731.1 hypothetical protein [Bradyrhizobium brasilense]